MGAQGRAGPRYWLGATSRAAWLLDQTDLLRYGALAQFELDLRGYLTGLLPHVEHLAESRPPDDVQAHVVLADVREARIRIDAPQADGTSNEADRVEGLARTARALCDHYDALTGMSMCLACDQPIESDGDSVPYDQISPSGGAAWSGRMHARCVNAGRPRR